MPRIITMKLDKGILTVVCGRDWKLVLEKEAKENDKGRKMTDEVRR
jgi:hypothetical protein